MRNSPPVQLNWVGRLTRAFLRSRLTLLIVLAVGLLGVMAVWLTPRMYNPEIVVPSATVMVQMPGANADEVDNQVVKPLEALMASLSGVDHTYGYAVNDQGIVNVQFKVGQDEEKSLVKLYNQIMRNLDRIPPGASQPLIKSTSINDVPILTVTLSSPGMNSGQLNRIGLRLLEQLHVVPDVGNTHIWGARPDAVNVWIDPVRLAASGLTLGGVERTLRGSNVVMPGGDLVSNNQAIPVRASGALTSAAQVGDIIVGAPRGRPVFLKDVASIEAGPADIDSHSLFAFGPADPRHRQAGSQQTAITLALAKRAGSNAVTVADAILAKLHRFERQALPQGVTVTITRDDGAKANEAVNTLIEHLLIAVVAVATILLIFLGWREATVVTVTVPLVLLGVLGVGWIVGQSINRITLFALILALGLLVDDAIVVIENVHRHLHSGQRQRFADCLIRATNEIGRPTNIATVAVILAFIPMAFVTGMMGPFMRPIPINVPVAMLISLGTAYVVVPWLAYRWMRGRALQTLKHKRTLEETDERPQDWLHRAYQWTIKPLLASRWKRNTFFAAVLLLLTAALLQPLWQFIRPQGINGPLSLGGVALKMLPDDNTNTFLVEVDTPADTPLALTDRVARAVGDVLQHTPYVTDYQSFVGGTAPPDFAAMVRGDMFRRSRDLAQIRVNLLPKSQRGQSSHTIVQNLDHALAPVRAKYPHTRIKLFETPPGPPVRAQVLAELYGPNYKVLRENADYIKKVFRRVYGIVNVDDSTTADAPQDRLDINRANAVLSGISPSTVAHVVHDYVSGFKIGRLHLAEARQPVDIVVRLPPPSRSNLQQILDLRVANDSGKQIPLGSLVQTRSVTNEKPFNDKDQHPVVYVSGDMLRSTPVNAVLAIRHWVNGKTLANGIRLTTGNLHFIPQQPDDMSRYQLFWGGEMRLTLDVFRDLGTAFIVALLLIYLLLVAYYQSFIMPLLVMGAIPLTVIGVFPGHWLLQQPFTATSMIGVIALAGIVVRNSLLLIDFILEYRRHGHSLEAAITEAGAVRVRPILLTALAIIAGSVIMVTDPVFGGLAISLIFGTFASTILTLLVIPLLYFAWQRRAGSQ